MHMLQSGKIILSHRMKLNIIRGNYQCNHITLRPDCTDLFEVDETEDAILIDKDEKRTMIKGQC
jgi:hypothetical protein